MALKLDNSLLQDLGLSALPESEKQLLLRQIYERLEMNVGMRLADQMSNEQLDAFEKFVDANDDKGAFQWLETNFPNYKDVVNQEFEKLKEEIRTVAPQILASVTDQQDQVAAGQMPQGAAQPQQPQQGAYGQPGQQPSSPMSPQPGAYDQPQQAPGQGQPYAMPPQPQQPQYGAPQQQPPQAPQPGQGQYPQYGQPQPGAGPQDQPPVGPSAPGQ